jgi:hypothetical protein
MKQPGGPIDIWVLIFWLMKHMILVQCFGGGD